MVATYTVAAVRVFFSLSMNNKHHVTMQITDDDASVSIFTSTDIGIELLHNINCIVNFKT